MSKTNQQTKFNLKVVPVTPFQQNAMIFWCTDSMNGVLIDPGGDVEQLMAAIEETGVNISAIWLTHGHIDHAGGAAECRRRLNCEIIGPHPDDQYWLDLLEEWGSKYDIAGAENFTPDRYLNEGDTVELEGMQFDIYHCPGHSPGSIVIYSPEMSFAFIGDVLFQGSIGRTDLPRSNHQDLIDSITKKLWPLDASKDASQGTLKGTSIQFMPGHGPGSTFEQERQNNGFVADSITGYKDQATW